jgi:hypothetical protein
LLARSPASLYKTPYSSNKSVQEGISLPSLKNVSDAKCDNLQPLEETQLTFNELYLEDESKNHQKYSLSGSQEEIDFFDKVIAPIKESFTEETFSECQSIVCGLSEVYSSKIVALRSMIVYKRFGYLLSTKQVSKEFRTNWDSVSSLVILEVLSNLPEYFHRLRTLKEFVLFPEKHTIQDQYREEIKDILANASTQTERNRLNNNIENLKNVVARARINTGRGIYDIQFNHRTFSGEINDAKLTFLHELTHHLDFTGDYSGEINDFQTENGWYEIATEVNNIPEQSCFPTNYASTAPGEDIAESIAYFVYQANSYQQKCPAQYSLIQEKFFSGKDYLVFPNQLIENFLTSNSIKRTKCLVPPVKKYFIFGENIYFQSSSTTFSTNYSPEINSNCYEELLFPILKEVSKEDGYCESGGKKEILTILFQSQKMAIDLVINQGNNIIKNKYSHKLALEHCLSKNTFNSDCISKYLTDLIEKENQQENNLMEMIGDDLYKESLKLVYNNFIFQQNSDLDIFSDGHLDSMLLAGFSRIEKVLTNRQDNYIFTSNFSLYPTTIYIKDFDQYYLNQISNGSEANDPSMIAKMKNNSKLVILDTLINKTLVESLGPSVELCKESVDINCQESYLREELMNTGKLKKEFVDSLLQIIMVKLN